MTEKQQQPKKKKKKMGRPRVPAPLKPISRWAWPKPGRCCICEQPFSNMQKVHWEVRPTGVGYRPARWPYCLPCWRDMKTIRSRPLNYEEMQRQLFRIRRWKEYWKPKNKDAHA